MISLKTSRGIPFQSALLIDMFLLMKVIVDREEGEDGNLSDRWRRRRRRRNQWFSGFFDRPSRTENDLDEMINRVFGKATEKGRTRKSCSSQLGDSIIPNQCGSCIDQENEPLIDVFDDEVNVFIVAEISGFDKDSIDLYATEDKLVVSLNSQERKYHREIKLPARVDVKSSASKLKNGVLEVRLKKLKEKPLIQR